MGSLTTSRTHRRFDRIRLVSTRANRQPTFADYFEDPEDGTHRAHGLMVLAICGNSICAITGFDDPTLFGYFGLPSTLED